MIPMFKVYNSERAVKLVEETLRSGYVGQGPRVDEFERELSRRMSDREVLTMNSCTSALDLALHLIGVEPGDIVLSTPQTCTATNGVIVNRGAKIVWCDIDPTTGNLDPDAVKRALSSCATANAGRVRAIMAVDWGGRACNYEALREIGLPIIEDAAHAVATFYDGRHISASGGDFVAFSFQAIKHLNTADGGALIVPDDQVERARLLRWYGLNRRSGQSFRCSQNITEVGYKYHMNDVAASIGVANISELDWVIDRHRANAKRYCSELGGIPSLGVPANDATSSWWIYSLLVPNPNEFIERMKAQGVETSPVHARNDKHDGIRRAVAYERRLPGVDYFADHHVAIPVGWWLSEDDVSDVIKATARSLEAA